MTDTKNDRICPEDEMRILLPANKIPDRSEVCKRTGESQFTLCRDLTLYKYGESSPPIRVTGYFLVGVRGSITQVEEDHLLHWLTTAEDFVDVLRTSWEEEMSQ